jgi:hypothetical protein
MGMILSFPAEITAESRLQASAALAPRPIEKKQAGGALRGLLFAVAIESVVGFLGWAAWTAIHALL